ncbi:MAG: hypothetical protein AAGA42_13515 [Actinomycetota bacterium]
MLSLSGNQTGHLVDAARLDDGAGVDDGPLLVGFVDGCFDQQQPAGAAFRELEQRRGHEFAVDAAAVVAAFHMMTRVADGSGTPLDAALENMSTDIRAGNSLDDLNSRRLESELPGTTRSAP